MDQLLTGNVWEKVGELLSAAEEKIAAIAYVTSESSRPTGHGWSAPLRSRSIYTREAELAEAGVQTARERMTHPENSVSWIRWVGKSRFRSTAKEGDSIIEVERNKQKTRCRVIQPRPILLRQDHGKWTRFYLDDPPEYTYFSWRQFIAEIKDSGVRRISQNTTRELTSREIAIMEPVWRGE